MSESLVEEIRAAVQIVDQCTGAFGLSADMERQYREAKKLLAAPEAIRSLLLRLEAAEKDAKNADEMSKALADLCEQHEKRWQFLHTINKDSEGFEWCVLRVKWVDGRISEALHTFSDLSDLDAAMTKEPT